MPAGTGQSEPDVTEIRELEERLDNLRIQTSDDLAIRGNAWQGYALDVPICGGGQVIACCFEDGSCQLLSPEQCVSSGGTITGGSCDPNPCGASTDLCITFEGITSTCGCVGPFFSGTEWKMYHDEGLNGTYQVSLISPNTWHLLISDGSTCYNVERWLNECVGEPLDTISGSVEVFVDFDGTDYLVRLRVSDDFQSSAFYGSGPGPVISDTHSCGDSTDIGPAYGIGGTATISTPPCDGPNPCSGVTGACCSEEGDCTIETEEDCITLGNDYQGDGTFCHPNPCPQPPPTGACCDYGDNSCTITTEDDCVGETTAWIGPDTICPDDCGF